MRTSISDVQVIKKRLFQLRELAASFTLCAQKLPQNCCAAAASHFNGNIARVGLNYHFGGPVVAAY